MWRLARDSGSLDLNPPYTYLLCCHQFHDTSIVARFDGEVVGFLTGFREQRSPETVFFWQLAVDDSQRGTGLARTMVDTLTTRVAEQGARYITLSVTPDNHASNALFRSLAERWNVQLTTSWLFEKDVFPSETTHEPEQHFRIGPFPGHRRDGRHAPRHGTIPTAAQRRTMYGPHIGGSPTGDRTE